jgi:hypothetical protein
MSLTPWDITLTEGNSRSKCEVGGEMVRVTSWPATQRSQAEILPPLYGRSSAGHP